MKFSRLSVLLTAAVVATSVLASTSKAHALTYNLNNVTFTGNSATATGSFDYVLAGNSYTGINIFYSGFPFSLGGVTFGQATFLSGSPTNLSLRLVNGLIIENLNFVFTPALGGSSSSVTGSYSYGNGSTSFNNTISGGTVTNAAPVPFDIPGGATIPAVGGLLALGLMRKARKSLASNTRISKPISEVVS